MKKVFIIVLLLFIVLLSISCTYEDIELISKGTLTTESIVVIDTPKTVDDIPAVENNKLEKTVSPTEKESSDSTIYAGQANTQVKSESTTESITNTPNESNSTNTEDSLSSETQSTSSTENTSVIMNNEGVDLPIDFFD